MNKHFLTGLFFLLAKLSVSQFSYDYNLKTKFDVSQITAKYDLKTIDELEVLDERIVEYAYSKEGSLFEYFYLHQIEYVNSDAAVDRNNKIYISSQRVTDLISYDVRVILPNGSIRTMGKDALKEGETEDKRKVNYFAVSGAEKGSFIEYYYLVKRNPNISGNTQSFKANVEKAKTVFKVISPSNLFFTSKSFCGFSDMKSDTSLTDKNMLVGETYNMPKTQGESFGNKEGNSPRVVYHLTFNTAQGKKNPFNFGVVSQNIFDKVVNSVSKNELKEVNKILKMSEIKFTPNNQEKVRAIENYVKKNFNFTEESDEKFENIESIVKVGALNDEGALRILYHLFDQSGIETEIVITSNRFKTPFEKDFESYVFLTDYLIYLPQLDLFISPFGQFFRAGLVPYGYIENYGLFIKKVSIGDIKTGAGKVKFIPAKPSSETQSNIVINAKLDNSLDSLLFSYKLSYTGYYAQNIQPYFEYIAVDKIKEFEESVLKSSLKDDITIKSLKIENKGIENLLVKPLVYNGEVSSNYFINKAGKKLLLKFGDLIGPQAELYQEVNRNLPIENDFNREYHREIVFTIPDNYVIKNPNDLIFNIQPFKNDNNAAEFVSSYKIEGNKLTVKIDEYYKIVKLPVASYEKFREVVNAAANFNKVVLVMETK